MAQGSEINGGGGVPEFLDSIQGNGFTWPVGWVVNWQVASMDKPKPAQTSVEGQHFEQLN